MEIILNIPALAIGYLMIIAVAIGSICYRQTDKALELISFIFFTIGFGWVTMGIAYLIGATIFKLGGFHL